METASLKNSHFRLEKITGCKFGNAKNIIVYQGILSMTERPQSQKYILFHSVTPLRNKN